MLVMPPVRAEGWLLDRHEMQSVILFKTVQLQILPPQSTIIIQALAGAPLAQLNNLR